MATVTVLKEGYAYLDEFNVMRANGTCTLIQSPETNVIVDTLTPWDKPLLLETLKTMDVEPEAVDYVVSTHGHSDHFGNNHLFLNAKYHIVGFCVSNHDQYYNHPFQFGVSFSIDQWIEVIPTPGHTGEDVCVVAKVPKFTEKEYDSQHNHKTIVVAGDLFEKEEDNFDPSLWVENSAHPERQAKQRLQVLKIADVIIPGHGNMFDVTPEHISAAEDVVKQYKEKTGKFDKVYYLDSKTITL